MPFVPIDLPPGVYKNGTEYQAKHRWAAANLVRWSNGAILPIGGWQKVRAGDDDLAVTNNVRLSLPGEAGDYASTPDAAALDILGDIDLRCAIAMTDWTPATSRRALISKLNAAETSGYGLFVETAGTIGLRWGETTLGAMSEVSSVAPTVTDGSLLLLRVTLDVDNGGSNYDATFYTKVSTAGTAHADLIVDTGWVQLGTVQNGAAATDIVANAEILRMGGSQNAGEEVDGDMYAATVVSGLDIAGGTLEFDADYSALTPGVTSFTELSANAATVTINQSGDPQAEIVADTSVGTEVQGLLGWRDNSGNSWLAIGTADKVWVFSRGGLDQITPLDFVGGNENAETTQNYGAGVYGVGVYGEGDPSQATIAEAQSWHFDNFGELLVGVAESDGRLLKWELDINVRMAEVDASAPTNNTGVVVTPERFLVALGADGDQRKIQWPDQESLTDWTPSDTNQAGDFPLSGKGSVLAGRRAKGETLIWTTEDLYAMRFIGGTLVYAFQRVGANCGSISKRSMAVVDNGRAYWMGYRSFFRYNGFVEPIPSTVEDFVFRDINRLQASKIHATSLAEVNTVIWFYPSAGSEDVDRYVSYNYLENHWEVGALNRTAMIDRGAFSYPMGADKNGNIYDHERGDSYLDIDDVTALVPFAETGPIEIGQGDRLAWIQELIPDELTLGDVEALLYTRLYPTSTETEHGPFSMANPTSLRLQGRQVRLRVQQVNTNWRVGVPRLDIELSSGR